MRAQSRAQPAGFGEAVVGEERHNGRARRYDAQIARAARQQAIRCFHDARIEFLRREHGANVAAAGMHHHDFGGDILRLCGA